MADIALSVTHSVAFADAVGKEKEKASPLSCLAGDYALTYGRVMVTVTHSGEGVENPEAGTVEFPSNSVMTILAKQQAISERDLQQASAFFETVDTKWRVTAGDCSFVPVKGDRVRSPDGTEYDVAGVTRIAFNTRYILWCRSVS